MMMPKPDSVGAAQILRTAKLAVLLCHAVPCCAPLQSLTDPDKLQHCRAVAERGLSDLMSYVNMSATADGGSYSINLKGATS
jgi:hypothetical protein